MKRNGLIVTTCFTALCVGVFVLQMLGLVSIEKYALWPQFVLQGGQYYRIVTGALMHADIQHIGANLLSFFNVGSYCEEEHGSKNMLITILITMLTSGLAVIFLGNSPTVGFSGVVFGVFGYFAVSLYKSGGGFDENEKALLARMLIPNILVSIMPGVSWQGHFGGFVGGVIAGLILIGKER